MSHPIDAVHRFTGAPLVAALALAVLGGAALVACGPAQAPAPADSPTDIGSRGIDDADGREIAAAGDEAASLVRPPAGADGRHFAMEIPNGPALGVPAVSVVRDAVAVVDAGGAARELSVDASAELEPGGELEVGPVGTAMLRWPEGLRAEILAGAELTFEPAPSGLRQALLVLEDGTARFSLPALEEPAALEVRTPAGGVLAVGGPADVIVGIRRADGAASGGDAVDRGASDAGVGRDESGNAVDSASGDALADPLVWIIVVQGEVSVTADDAVASADASSAAAPPAGASLRSGEAVVIARGGRLQPLVLPVDVVSVETWYGQILSGYAETPIADAAFRCRTSAPGAVLHDAPARTGRPIRAAAGAGMPLGEGALVDAKARTADGLWVKAVAAETLSVGWLPAADLDCIAPVAGLPEADALALAPATPTPAFAPVPATVSFVADALEIAVGGCVTLRWDVPVGGDVAFDGRSVPGKGWQRACPETTRSYALSWIDASGRRQERAITVQVDTAPPAVQAALQSQGQGQGQGQAPPAGGGGAQGGGGGASGAPPTPTLCPEDCIVEMPTLAPTATIPPRPTRAPTLAPEPTAPPPPPTAAPEPTEPPPPPPAEPTAPPPPPPAEPTDPPAEPTVPPGEPSVTPTPTPTSTPTSTPTPTATSEATETEPPAEPSQTPTPEPSPSPGSGFEAGQPTRL